MTYNSLKINCQMSIPNCCNKKAKTLSKINSISKRNKLINKTNNTSIKEKVIKI